MMAKLTIGLGIVLVGLGLAGYLFLTGDEKSWTALIPAIFGVPLVILGALALRDAWRKTSMHVAVVLGVLGAAGTFRGLLKLPALLTRADELERPAAIGVQSLMCVLCLVFIGLCVASFVSARR